MAKPLLLENMTLHAESPLLNALWDLVARTWGNAGYRFLDKALLEPLRELAADRSEARCSVTALKSVVIARYLGQCPCKQCVFSGCMATVASEFNWAEACPRVGYEVEELVMGLVWRKRREYIL